MSLNSAQHEAVHTLKGPLLVLAGAGTGKTRVVTYRIAELIRSGIEPQRILAVTFTNKAAAEMQERATALLGKRLINRPEISTFHSLCVRILRRSITHLGYPEKFAIYDRGDQESIARQALREIKVPGETLRPGDLLYLISRWKSAGVRPEEAASIAATDKEHLASMAYRRYQKNLKLAGAVDFDDLLLLTEELYRKFPEVRREDATRYDHLLIDEYQDTNGSQYRIVKALATRHRNLCVVGDDDQAIYGWRGAEVTHILNFRKDWPDAKIVRLEDNYRSTAAILNLANRLIKFNAVRNDKVLKPARVGGERPQIRQFRDEEEEAREVVRDIAHQLNRPGLEPRDIAILFRTNEQPRAFEAELRQAKLAYVLIGGMSFYDRKEVRDVLAYLKLLASPQDEVSLLRIINKPPRGIGQSTVAQLMQRAVDTGRSTWDMLYQAERFEEISSAALKAIGQFRVMIERYVERLQSDSLVDVASDLLHEIGYRKEIERLYSEEQDQQARWAAVEEVINALGNYQRRAKSKATLDGFLEEVALSVDKDDDDKESQLKKNAIALMTLHAAKGLEFPHVYLVGMEEGLLPHKRSIATGDAAIDEERRLCYVGITRAQDRLTMSLALTRMKWGKHRDTIPSRFLYELSDQTENARAAAKRAADPRNQDPQRRKTVKKKSAKRRAPGPAATKKTARPAPRKRPGT